MIPEVKQSFFLCLAHQTAAPAKRHWVAVAVNPQESVRCIPDERNNVLRFSSELLREGEGAILPQYDGCLLYTSDAADE